MDIARVDRLSRHLQENPECHWQGRYTCGTTGCVAGWAVALEYGAYAGAFLDIYIRSLPAFNATPAMGSEWDFCVCRDDGNCTSNTNSGDSHTFSIDAIARHARMLLGLSKVEAIAIFYRTVAAGHPEADAVALLNALVHREKSELSDADIEILEKYHLPIEPSSLVA